MEKNSYKSIFRLIFLAGIISFSGCENLTILEKGTLEGTISIGPICPVETNPPDPGCLPTAETYKAYPVYVCTSDGTKKITLISPELDGSFETVLAPGKYLIILDKEPIGIGSSNLPQKITINPLETIVISIDIDTGIR